MDRWIWRLGAKRRLERNRAHRQNLYCGARGEGSCYASGRLCQSISQVRLLELARAESAADARQGGGRISRLIWSCTASRPEPRQSLHNHLRAGQSSQKQTQRGVPQCTGHQDTPSSWEKRVSRTDCVVADGVRKTDSRTGHQERLAANRGRHCGETRPSSAPCRHTKADNGVWFSRCKAGRIRTRNLSVCKCLANMRSDQYSRDHITLIRL